MKHQFLMSNLAEIRLLAAFHHSFHNHSSELLLQILKKELEQSDISICQYFSAQNKEYHILFYNKNLNPLLKMLVQS
jgi:hypothetical protein